VKIFLLCSLWLLLPLTSWNAAAEQTRWLSDQLPLDLRSGNSNRYRVIKMLEPGTKVRVLKVDKKAGFSQIKTEDGSRGWVNNSYLMEEPSGREQLAEAQALIEQLTSENEPLKAQVIDLQAQAEQLSLQLEAATSSSREAQAELAHISEISSDAISLDRNNKKLMESNQLLQHEIDVLKGENTRLADGSNREWFINGVFAVGFGVLLALVIPRITPKRKHTEWR
jgi:SH3 domain protein